MSEWAKLLDNLEKGLSPQLERLITTLLNEVGEDSIKYGADVASFLIMWLRANILSDDADVQRNLRMIRAGLRNIAVKGEVAINEASAEFVAAVTEIVVTCLITSIKAAMK